MWNPGSLAAELVPWTLHSGWKYMSLTESRLCACCCVFINDIDFITSMRHWWTYIPVVMETMAHGDELSKQTYHFLGRTVRLYCKILHLSCWGQSGWIQWGRHKRRWHERCCRGWISEILATDWMAGVRKAGEDFFWNSELNDKHKCNYIVKVESS